MKIKEKISYIDDKFFDSKAASSNVTWTARRQYSYKNGPGRAIGVFMKSKPKGRRWAYIDPFGADKCVIVTSITMLTGTGPKEESDYRKVDLYTYLWIRIRSGNKTDHYRIGVGHSSCFVLQEFNKPDWRHPPIDRKKMLELIHGAAMRGLLPMDIFSNDIDRILNECE